jgi:hypothetical protein
MSILDKVVAAVTPPESDEQRRQARERARAAAGANDWLSLVLQHHVQIEAAFDAVGRGTDAVSRRRAQKQLAVLLTGHSNAEEAVIYPAMVHMGEKASATMSFTEQAGAKINLSELEYMDPMSQEFMDKLEHVRGAVRHHMYEEESSRFLELKNKMPAVQQELLTQRFKEEFERYVGEDMLGRNLESAAAMRSAAAPAAPTSQPQSH